MPIDEVIDALQGFSSAYGKVAAERESGVQHNLRVSEINKSSFELVVLAWIVLGDVSNQLQALNIVTGASRWVVSTIAGYITAKKHAHNQPYTTRIDGDNNTVVVINAQGASLSLPPEVFRLFESRTLDEDIGRIAEPLQDGEVNSAKISARDTEPVPIEEELTTGDKPYFEPPDVEDEPVVTSKATSLDGHFISLNKETNRGTFELPGGNHVPYHYLGSNPFTLHRDFAYRGPVRIKCEAFFDKDLSPIRLDIASVRRLQRSFRLTSPRASRPD